MDRLSTRRRAGVIGLAAVAALAGGVCGAPPRPIGVEIITRPSMTPDERAVVDAWVDYYCTQLATSTTEDTEAIETARERLQEPLKGRLRRPAESFRLYYSTSALERLVPVIEGDEGFAAVNALLVLGSLGTDKALSKALDHADRRREPRWQVRLVAASAGRMILAEGHLPGRRVTSALRRVTAAAAAEDNDLVLPRQLQAIAAAADADFGAEVKPQIREIWTEAIDEVIDGIVERGEPSMLVRALALGVPAYRNEYLKLSVEEQRNLGATMGPALGRLIQHASMHADDVRDDSTLRFCYGEAIQACQVLLNFIDSQVRDSQVRRDSPPPQTRLDQIWGKTWSAGDHRQFESGVKGWMDVLSRPPYKP